MNRAQYRPDELYSGGLRWWIDHQPAELVQLMKSPEALRTERIARATVGRPMTPASGLVHRIIQSFNGATKPLACGEIRDRAAWHGNKKQFFEALQKAYERGLLERVGVPRFYKYRKPT